jgi:hypothetical protein
VSAPESAIIPSLADAAISYARAGWPVHPLKRREKIPASPHGCKDATFDADRIREWWEQIPDANIGIATGHGFFVVDLDGPAAALWADANELPDTLTAITAKGRHLFYALPPNTSVRNSAGQVAPGVDIRGTGGYVVAPPSVHRSCAADPWRIGAPGLLHTLAASFYAAPDAHWSAR